MAHPDLDRLLDHCLPFAQAMLKKHGEFLPFAATIGTNGELTSVATSTGEEHPSATELIEQCTGIFKNLASNGEIVAAAICYDGRVSVGGKEKKDAITVSLEHSGAECVTVYMPYSKTFWEVTNMTHCSRARISDDSLNEESIAGS